MKKKLLLIPIALLSCFVAGCEYDTYVVTLNQWMEHNGPMAADPHFYVANEDEEKTGGFTDYEERVGKAIKSRVIDAEEVKTKLKNSIVTDSYVEYGISCHLREMSHCSVHVYDNGYITTFAYAEQDFLSSIFGRPKDQKVVYKIDEEKAKEIINLATDRYVEIKTQKEKDQAELEEAAKIENVLNTFDQSEEELKIWYGYTGSGAQYTLTFPDAERELLEELKTVTYTKADDEFIYEKLRNEMVAYRIDDDLQIIVYNHNLSYDETNYDLVSTRIHDTGKYPGYYYQDFYYKIDPEQGRALVRIAHQLFMEYNADTI